MYDGPPFSSLLFFRCPRESRPQTILTMRRDRTRRGTNNTDAMGAMRVSKRPSPKKRVSDLFLDFCISDIWSVSFQIQIIPLLGLPTTLTADTLCFNMFQNHITYIPEPKIPMTLVIDIERHMSVHADWHEYTGIWV